MSLLEVAPEFGWTLRPTSPIMEWEVKAMLNVKDRECFEEVCAKIRSAYPEARLWAFGSRARGEETVDSDLDVCVVLRNLDWDARTKVSDIAWEVGFGHDRLIATIVFSEDQFELGPCSQSPLVKSIRDEGVAT